MNLYNVEEGGKLANIYYPLMSALTSMSLYSTLVLYFVATVLINHHRHMCRVDSRHFLGTLSRGGGSSAVPSPRPS